MIRRETEEAESLPEPPRALPPKAAQEPEWREELNRKLAGYRERREGHGQGELFGGEETSELPAAPMPERPKSKLPPIREARRDDLPAPRREPPATRSILPPAPSGPEWKTDARQVRSATPIKPPIVDQRDPLPLPTEQEPPQRDPRDRAAPISLRLVAGLMDMAVVAAALGVFVTVCIAAKGDILGGMEGLRLISLAFLLLLAFYWIFYLRFLGRTAGMTWLGLRVLNFDGDPPDEGQRRARAFGTVLSAAALGIGFAWAAADESRLTWHDRISKTFVALDQ